MKLGIAKLLRRLQTFAVCRLLKRKKDTAPLFNGWMAELPNGEFITALNKPKNSKYKFKKIKFSEIDGDKPRKNLNNRNHWQRFLSLWEGQKENG